MKLENKTIIETDVALEDINFSTDPADQYFLMKSTFEKIYTDKEGSVIRELASNAYDATIASGNKKPFVIEIKDNVFTITDFGTGLTNQSIDAICSPGKSTKRNDDKNIGGFGLGSKSPFCITDVFFYESVCNGKLITIDFVNTGSKYQINKKIEDTDEKINYTKVQFDIQDELKWYNKVKFELAFFPNFVLCTNNLVEKPNIVPFKNFIYSSWYDDINYVLNGVALIRVNSECIIKAAPRFKIEELKEKMTTSRESIDLQINNKAIIEELIEYRESTDNIILYLTNVSREVIAKGVSIRVYQRIPLYKYKTNISWKSTLEIISIKSLSGRKESVALLDDPNYIANLISKSVFNLSNKYPVPTSAENSIVFKSNVPEDIRQELVEYFDQHCIKQDKSKSAKMKLLRVIRDSERRNSTGTAIHEKEVSTAIKNTIYYTKDEALAREIYILFSKLFDWKKITICITNEKLENQINIDENYSKIKARAYKILSSKTINRNAFSIEAAESFRNHVQVICLWNNYCKDIFLKYKLTDYTSYSKLSTLSSIERSNSKMKNILKCKLFLNNLYFRNLDNIGKQNLKLKEKWEHIKLTELSKA